MKHSLFLLAALLAVFPWHPVRADAEEEAFVRKILCLQSLMNAVESDQIEGLEDICDAAAGAPFQPALPPSAAPGTGKAVLAPVNRQGLEGNDAQQLDCLIAMNRFGYGGRPDMPDTVCKPDAFAWVEQQIGQDGAPAALLSGLPSTEAIITRRETQKKDKPDFDEWPFVQDTFHRELGTRLQAAAQSSTPFTERLVSFWSNHFNVYRDKETFVLLITGAYEREAIRKNVYGKFEDMLLAVAQHPAMLFYLDNQESFGAETPCAKGGKGLNENLGREILELHTLGVNGGYTQDDVRGLSRALTGWTIDFSKGTFRYDAGCHDNREKKILGNTYASTDPDKQQEQTRDILRMIARQPATARFLARKLAVHFVSDNPSEQVVNRLAQVYLDNQGDLSAVYRVLVRLPEIREKPLDKLKTPFDMVVSGIRVHGADKWLDERIGKKETENIFGGLGSYRLWKHPAPDGWSDKSSDWLSSQAALSRADWCAGQFNSLRNKDIPVEKVTGAAVLDFGKARQQLMPILEQNRENEANYLGMLCISPWFQRR